MQTEEELDVFDPAAIGTTILLLERERRREAEVERRGRAIPREGRTSSRKLSRDLARWLRSAADRLEPGAGSDARPAV
jgi:hypothetical protein